MNSLLSPKGRGGAEIQSILSSPPRGEREQKSNQFSPLPLGGEGPGVRGSFGDQSNVHFLTTLSGAAAQCYFFSGALYPPREWSWSL
jgi:hypothetical protein